MSEASSYTAWDENLYEWPPPDGWYQAPDGRWWPPGYGPEVSTAAVASPTMNGDSSGGSLDGVGPGSEPGATGPADPDPTFDPDRTSMFPAGGFGTAPVASSDRYDDESRRRMFEEPPPIDDLFGGIDPFAPTDDASDDRAGSASDDPPVHGVGSSPGQQAIDPRADAEVRVQSDADVQVGVDAEAQVGVDADAGVPVRAEAQEPTVLIPPGPDAPDATEFATVLAALDPPLDDAPLVPEPVLFDHAQLDGPPAAPDPFGATRPASPLVGLDAGRSEDATSPIDLGPGFEPRAASAERTVVVDSTVGPTVVASSDWGEGRGGVHAPGATTIASEVSGTAPADGNRADPGTAPSPRRLWPLAAIGLAVALVAVGVGAYLALRPGGDDAADAAEAEVVGPGSFDEPYGFGTGVVVFYADEATAEERRWVIQVLDQVIDATDTLVDEVSANPPGSGRVLATVRVRVTYQSGPEPGSLEDLRFNAVGASRTSYTQVEDGCSAVTDPVDLAASLAVLESTEGNLCWSVAAEDLPGLNLAIEAGDTAGTVHMQLR